jgi:hypothetical protein
MISTASVLESRGLQHPLVVLALLSLLVGLAYGTA